jgi:two-component system sensor histidine kinase ChiS
MELLARVRSLLKVKAYNDLLSNYRKELELEVSKRTEELRNLNLVLTESNAAMRRFVPEQFLRQLGKSSVEQIKLGDHTAMDMVVMFVHIREFSTLSEKMTPEETFAFINQCMAALGPPVRNHGGFIDKYIGDSIMALFPSPPPSAVRCAIEMHGRLGDLNAQREKAGSLPIRIGIGLHEGRLMLGTIGENERMDGTVISDTVNTASRIEGISKQFGIGVAVSERILLGLGDIRAYHTRSIGKVGVKGRREEIPIFEIYDGDPEPLRRQKDAIKDSFERAVTAFYSQKYEQALELFNRVLVYLPDDQASFHYIRIMRKLSMS